MKRNFIDFRKGTLILSVIMGMAKLSSAQVAVGTTTPDPSAQFQIESTSKGLLIPRVTTTDDVTAPATGLLVYQTGGTAGFYYNSGTSVSPNWVRVSDAATALADGSVTNAKVATTAGIVYSKLALTNSIQNGDITANAITTSKVANETVTTSKIQDSAVSSLKILTNAVNNAHIANGTLLPAKLSASGATSGQVLGFDGSNISWTTPSSGSSLSTGSTAGQVYLTGAAGVVPTTPVSVSGDATLSSTGVLTLGASGVAAGSYGIPGSATPLITIDSKGRITSAANTTLNLTSAQFTNQGTTTTLLHGNAAGVPSFGPIVNGDIAANSITTSKVVDGTVTTSKMADSAISGLKILSNAVNNAHIANGTLLPAKLSASGAASGQVLTYNGSNIVWGNATAATADYAFANADATEVDVFPGGTNVPLASNQRFNNITVDGSNTSFTVNNSGTFRIEYNINASSATFVSARLLINGTTEQSSYVSPNTATTFWHASTIVTLSAGDVINLQLFGLLGAVTLQSGQGAGLTIEKL